MRLSSINPLLSLKSRYNLVTAGCLLGFIIGCSAAYGTGSGALEPQAGTRNQFTFASHSSGIADPDTTYSLRDGVFTAEQAARGEQVFDNACFDCHEPDDFTVEDFVEKWSGQTVNTFFEFVKTSMPQEEPGSLTDQQYADVLTYLFQLNGHRTGESEMPTDSTGLAAIRIEQAKDAENGS